MMKSCKCADGGKSEKGSRCCCTKLTVASLQNPHLARQLRPGSSGKRKAALAGMSKEELVQVTMSRVLLHEHPGGQYPITASHN